MTNCIKLNLARNCLKYLIRKYGIREIFIPYYTCETVWQAAREQNCKVKFYHINKNFMPSDETIFSPEDFILYINYFGLFVQNCNELSKRYKNLIIDNTHGFYAKHCGLASFNSLRKFFPLTCGAFLFTNQAQDLNLPTDTLNLEIATIQDKYEQFVQNELKLNRQKEIKLINPQVLTEFEQIDFEKDKKTRIELYQKYSQKLDKYNKLKIKLSQGSIPYCYPFSPADEKVKNLIINNKLILLHLWKNFPNNMPECKFLNDITALPLNDINYSEKIISVFE